MPAGRKIGLPHRLTQKEYETNPFMVKSPLPLERCGEVGEPNEPVSAL
jgi:hypothetical protein